MRKPKLNYTFHNPNPPDVTAEYICKLFIEVNKDKAETAIQAAANKENGKRETTAAHEKM